MVLTKEGDITNIPWEDSKERNDWITVEATEEQGKLLDVYFAEKVEDIEVVEVITMYEVKPITEKAKTIVEPEIVKADYIEPIAETPAPKNKKSTKK
jgi:hypothetical protein